MMKNPGSSLYVKPLSEWIDSLFNPAPRRILFRLDAGRVWGLSFGHAARCVLLANAAQHRWHASCLFLMKDDPDGVPFVRDRGYDVKSIPANASAEDELQAFRGEIKAFQPDWTVIDLLTCKNETAYFARLKAAPTHTLCIDDTRFRVPPVDAYLNTHILAQDKITQDKTGNVNLFLGPQYFLFDQANLACKPIRVQEKCNVVLSFGGSDLSGLTVKTLHTLIKPSWPEAHFYIILGPGFADGNTVQELIEGRREFSLAHNPPQVLPYFMGCDFALCAGGRTMYELMALGKPFYPIASAGHEQEAVQAIKNMGYNIPSHAALPPISQRILACVRDAD